MKKFWSIFTVALVALSAVSCSNNFEEEVVLGGETLSFNVNIDNTRTALEQDKNGWNTVWVGNETLVVSDGTNSYSFKNSTENKNKFTCTAEGVRSLIGNAVNVVYNNVINSAAGAAGMTLKGKAENFSESVAIELAADNAFLKLTSTADVTLTASAEIFGDGSARLKSVTVKAGTDVLVPIYAAKEVTLSAIKDVTVKEKVLTFENNKIYNLGTLTEAPTIYLVPNADWKQADAWYSAHFYNSNGGFADVKMTDADADGIYECKVPANMTDVIFCRMNPAYPEFSWNSEEENNHVWNETISSTIGVEPNNYYYITDWTAGEWHEANYEFPVVTESYKVYVYQYENTWSKLNLYSWNSSTNANYTGSWPGTANTTTETINGYKYRVWELPTAATGKNIMVILNNGSSQTGDSGPYTINGNLYLLLRGTSISVIEDPNSPEPTVELQPRSIYALAEHTSTLNIYWWNAGPTWPGEAMTTEYINGKKYYKYTFNKSLDGSVLAGVIFNNGSAQTGDIKNVKLDKDLFYKVNSNWSYSLIADPR